MDKIAIISDIHGNLPAFEAVLADIERNKVDKIICLGDIIGKGPNCHRVIDLCREKCDAVVSGNWDKYLVDNKDSEKEDVHWYITHIGEERLQYLESLPMVKGFYLSGRYVRLFHAHPHNVYTRIFQRDEREEKLVMFEVPELEGDDERCESTIVGYGDIHGSYMEGHAGGKVLFNVGSVGNPCDHIPKASYVIMEGELDSKKESDYTLQFRRVSYDIARAKELAIESDVPNKQAYLKELETAIYSR